MAGGAPSRKSQAIGRAASPVTLDLDALTASTPPRETLAFSTATVRTHAHEEERDPETGDVTVEAAMEVEFVGPVIVSPLGDTILVQGGAAYRTRLTPDFAVTVFEAALEEARAVAASRKEQPLNSTIPIASSMADVAAAAEQAAAVEQDLKEGGS